MSLDLHVVELDLAALQAAKGSGNRTLLRRVLRSESERIADHDEEFRSDTEPYLPLGEAIRQVIDGKIDRLATPRIQFEHAVALIADTLGRPLDADLFQESRPGFWDEVDRVIQRRLRAADASETACPGLWKVLERGPFPKVPLDPHMSLGSGYLTSREVARALAVAKTLDLDSTRGLGRLRWPAEALEGANLYRGWLAAAAANGRGLYFHC
jgi:hypothetical protein